MDDLIRRRSRIRACAAGLLTVALVVGGCGSDDDERSGGGGEVVVSAATSLTEAFNAYGAKFDAAEARFSFAGSDELATQIRSGAKPDVFASANTRLPDELFQEGVVEQPVVFATNRLVLAVPNDSDKVRSLGDLVSKQVTLAIGAADVPIGSYTRRVLDALPAADETKILSNVKTKEPNVGGIAAKLTQNAVDAGFLYITDVEATNGRLKAIELPAKLQPEVAYGVAIVKGGRNPEAAQSFIDGLLGGAGADALRDAGFEPPAT